MSNQLISRSPEQEVPVQINFKDSVVVLIRTLATLLIKKHSYKEAFVLFPSILYCRVSRMRAFHALLMGSCQISNPIKGLSEISLLVHRARAYSKGNIK